jgi:hypothetical protein
MREERQSPRRITGDRTQPRQRGDRGGAPVGTAPARSAPTGVIRRRPRGIPTGFVVEPAVVRARLERTGVVRTVITTMSTLSTRALAEAPRIEVGPSRHGTETSASPSSSDARGVPKVGGWVRRTRGRTSAPGRGRPCRPARTHSQPVRRESRPPSIGAGHSLVATGRRRTVLHSSGSPIPSFEPMRIAPVRTSLLLVGDTPVPAHLTTPRWLAHDSRSGPAVGRGKPPPTWERFDTGGSRPSGERCKVARRSRGS